jgi:uncharacterized protein YceK
MPSTNSNYNPASFGGDRAGASCEQVGSSAMSPRALWAALTLLQAAAGVLVWHANGGTLFSGPLVTFVVHKVRWYCTADCSQSTLPNQLCFWYPAFNVLKGSAGGGACAARTSLQMPFTAVMGTLILAYPPKCLLSPRT